MIQRNPGDGSPFFCKGITFIEENEELLPHHTIVHETEWGLVAKLQADWDTLPIKLSAEKNGGHHGSSHWC